MDCSVDIIRRVWDNGYGVFVQVAPDSEGLGGIRIQTTDNASEDFFGKIDVTLYGKEFVGKLVECLVEAHKGMK